MTRRISVADRDFFCKLILAALTPEPQARMYGWITRIINIFHTNSEILIQIRQFTSQVCEFQLDFTRGR
ncbi:hypothetical protein BKG68_04210 [Mycobacteroides saopaulense]|uniref:Uncharacterized protein n=1 Tax=Mycobacteroides saopaulense TaxID=1578165 RepID=A0ABX3C5X5_9MYCO|nr:hypothetical protein BKG68_04210 [Mycobacteroides saopaulense]OHU13881.1 hypothetical protein BKG73_04220 [Mycobacteroides saopaulense]